METMNQITTTIIGVDISGKRVVETAKESIAKAASPDFDISHIEYAFADKTISDDEIGKILDSKELAIIVSDSYESVLKISSESKSRGILTVAVITRPQNTDAALPIADCIIDINESTDITALFMTIFAPIYRIGIIGIDFDDAKAILTDSGKCCFLSAKGQTGVEVAEALLSLMPSNVKRIQIDIISPEFKDMVEIEGIVDALCERAHPDTNVIFSCEIESSLKEFHVGMICCN